MNDPVHAEPSFVLADVLSLSPPLSAGFEVPHSSVGSRPWFERIMSGHDQPAASCTPLISGCKSHGLTTRRHPLSGAPLFLSHSATYCDRSVGRNDASRFDDVSVRNEYSGMIRRSEAPASGHPSERPRLRGLRTTQPDHGAVEREVEDEPRSRACGSSPRHWPTDRRFSTTGR